MRTDVHAPRIDQQLAMLKTEISKDLSRGSFMVLGSLVLTMASLIAKDMVVEVLLSLATAALICLCFLFPEIAFLFFINAGVYKPALETSGITEFLDMTLLFEFLCLTGIVIGIARRRIELTMPPLKMVLPYVVMAAISVISLSYTGAPLYGQMHCGMDLNPKSLLLG
jgi:hypothetical protein